MCSSSCVVCSRAHSLAMPVLLCHHSCLFTRDLLLVLPLFTTKLCLISFFMEGWCRSRYITSTIIARFFLEGFCFCCYRHVLSFIYTLMHIYIVPKCILSSITSNHNIVETVHNQNIWRMSFIGLICWLFLLKCRDVYIVQYCKSLMDWRGQ